MSFFLLGKLNKKKSPKLNLPPFPTSSKVSFPLPVFSVCLSRRWKLLVEKKVQIYLMLGYRRVFSVVTASGVLGNKLFSIQVFVNNALTTSLPWAPLLPLHLTCQVFDFALWLQTMVRWARLIHVCFSKLIAQGDPMGEKAKTRSVVSRQPKTMIVVVPLSYCSY